MAIPGQVTLGQIVMPEEYKFFLFAPFLLQWEVPKMLWSILFQTGCCVLGFNETGKYSDPAWHEELVFPVLVLKSRCLPLCSGRANTCKLVFLVEHLEANKITAIYLYTHVFLAFFLLIISDAY